MFAARSGDGDIGHSPVGSGSATNEEGQEIDGAQNALLTLHTKRRDGAKSIDEMLRGCAHHIQLVTLDDKPAEDDTPVLCLSFIYTTSDTNF